METNDFIPFLMMTIILFAPLVWIYLILYTLNWGERKRLFSDSWIVFITWLVSSLGVYILGLSAEFGFYKLFHGNIYVTFFPFTLIANILSIAAVLKSRENKKSLSIVADSNEEKIQKTDNGKIWKTSAIVSVLTLAMVFSLFMFIGDITTRIEKLNPKPKYESGYAVYE